MKFTIEKKIFLENLKLVNEISSNVSEKNFLLFTKIICENKEIKLISSNNTMHICIKIKKGFFNCLDGSTLMQKDKLLKIVEKINNDHLTLDVLENNVEIYEKINNKKKISFNLPHASEEIKFPEIVFDEFEKNINIPYESLSKAIYQVYFIALKNENNPELSSINLNVINNAIEFTTFDHIRCAKISIQEKVKENNFFNVSIPISNMLKINNIFKSKKNINISTDNKSTIIFKSEDIIVSSNLLNKEFPIKDLKKEKFIAKDDENKIKVLKIKKNEFLSSLEQVLILSDEERMVKMEILHNEIKLFSGDYCKKIGNATATIEQNSFTFSNKENFEIYFNGNYVLDAIKPLNEEIKFTFLTRNKPFIIENADDDNVIQVIAPMTE